jgi:transcriptional regulator with XRE-family HTH domain
MHPETKKLIRALLAWCQAQRGRRSQLARQLGVSPGTVGDWISGRRMPSLDQGNQIKAIIARRGRK